MQNPGTYDWESIPLIIDVLTHALNLREIVLPFIYPSIKLDRRLGEVLCALQHLTAATFDTVDETAITLMQRSQWARRVECLHLRFRAEGAQPYYPSPFRDESKHVAYPSLLCTLTTFTSLHTLCLSFLRMDPSSPTIPDIARGLAHSYYLRSLCILDLWKVEPPALDIVPLCPRLSSLVYSLLVEAENETDNPLAEGTPWPPLRHLRVGTLEDAAHARHVLGRVHHLAIYSDIYITEKNPSQAAMLLTVVEKTAPVGMHFSLTFDKMRCDAEAQLWAALAARAPKLRVLEVKLQSGAYAIPEFTEWLYTLPSILSPLAPVLCSLRLLVSRSRGRYSPRWHRCHDKTVLESSSPHDELAAALPALNCLELWEAGHKRVKRDHHRDTHSAAGEDDIADTDSYVDWALDWDSAEDEDDDMRHVPKAEREPRSVYGRWEDCHGMAVDYKALYRRWWRVRRRSEEDTGGAPALESIGRMEAKRMHTYLRDADNEGVERFDDVFP
ncbi:hypothetical protein C2E23DRAFT_526214 [Lenzites betulinus]|nr:hypothetical protein C2E23DRAFT_526214 [Lenzites betulinus]